MKDGTSNIERAMARFVQSEVAERRDRPTEGETVTLVLGIVSGHTSTAKQRVTELGGEVNEELPFDSLLVDIPENELTELCEISEIESIELDESMEILAGN